MFRTALTLSTSTKSIGLQDKILTTGSCFSDAIGKTLINNKFTTSSNPFGISYNPYSIHKTLRYAIHNQMVSQHTFLQSQDIYKSYDFHSEFSALEKSKLENQLKEAVGFTHYFLKASQWLIITYGTSWIFERSDTGEIVSNCHKAPAANFTKTLLSQKRILEDFNELHQELLTFNPALQIILTVSPVRHIKDSIPLNSVSKSVLRLACHTLAETYSNVQYFPAYEIMLDDLRDYRFYKSDLIHPNEQAEEYIWLRFSETYFNKATLDVLKEWNSIRAALEHKPFHPESMGHQKFLRETLKKLESLRPQLNVENEILVLQAQLISK